LHRAEPAPTPLDERLVCIEASSSDQGIEALGGDRGTEREGGEERRLIGLAWTLAQSERPVEEQSRSQFLEFFGIGQVLRSAG
jgi:hypothetical protein